MYHDCSLLRDLTYEILSASERHSTKVGSQGIVYQCPEDWTLDSLDQNDPMDWYPGGASSCANLRTGYGVNLVSQEGQA